MIGELFQEGWTTKTAITV